MSAFAKGKLKLIKEALAAKDWPVVQKQATSVPTPCRLSEALAFSPPSAHTR